jgi:hypothetical protein
VISIGWVGVGNIKSKESVFREICYLRKVINMVSKLESRRKVEKSMGSHINKSF